MSAPPPPLPPRFPLAELVRGARATQALLVVNAGVYLAMLVSGCAGCPRTLHRYGAIFAIDGRPDGWWRVLSSAFVHFSIGHLLLNLFGIAVFGSEMERRHGTARFAALFLGSAALGGAFTVAFTDGPVVAAGASGGVYGLIGGWVALLLFDPARRGGQQAMGLVLFVAISLALGAGDERVGNLAHLGGALGGLSLGCALEAARRLRRPAPPGPHA